MRLDQYSDDIRTLYEGLMQPQRLSLDDPARVARQAADQGKAQGDQALRALGLLWEGLLGYMGSSDDPGLDRILEECIAAAQEAGEPYLLGRAYNVLALEALSRGQSLLTYNYLNLVLDCSQRLDGREGMHLESLASGNLGAAYLYLGDYQKARDYDLRALTLREAMAAEDDRSILAAYATDVGLASVGTGELAMARTCFDAISGLLDSRPEEEMDPNDLYFMYELGMYLFEAEGDDARRHEQVEQLIGVAARLDDLVSDFMSVCRDIRHLVDKGLLDEASRLIEAVRAFLESSTRPYVRALFIESELAYVRAASEKDREAPLAIALCGQMELVRQYERQQTLNAFTMLDGVRATHDENVRLSYQSRHDELTHLLNRKALREDFPALYGHDLWAIMIDIDHFKQFNDSMGHGAGDSVLRGVAGAIRASFTQGGCYRLGGDEFLVLAEGMDGCQVREALEFCQQAIPEVAGSMLDGGQAMMDRSVGISAGCARGIPADADGLRALMKQADERLFEAKRSGRGTIRGA